MTASSSTAKPLSIGFVTPAWPPESVANGIASYTGTIVKALREIGAACHVFSRSVASGNRDPFVHTIRPNYNALYSRLRHRLDPLGWPQKRFAEAVLDVIGQVHSRDQLDLMEMEESFGWAGLIADRCPVPIVVRLHGPWFLNGAANGAPRDEVFEHRDLMEAVGLKTAAVVTSPSHDVLRQTREHFGLPLPNAVVIANAATTSAEFEWHLDGCDPGRIAFIGRFDRHKGGDLALRAFAKIVEQFPEASLDLVGPDRGLVDQSGRNWSLDQYLQANIPVEQHSRVRCHGFLPGSQAAQIRKKALVTIVPSRYETFGLTAAEAMLAGCPLVVGQAGALTELVEHNRNGLVARAGDADDLAEKVLSLLRNPSRAADLGRQAAIDANHRYSPDVVAVATMRFYRSLLNR
jgi:glycosyltransferase involved in cell wall biosynthesis